MSSRRRSRPATLAPLAAALLAPFALPAQSTTRPVLPPPRAVIDSADPVALMVARLDLERYKATIKGLTQFGDRRQGTSRNRAALDWIETQLTGYGCTTTERLTYTYTSGTPRMAAPAAEGRPAVPRPAPSLTTQGGGRPRGVRTRTGVNSDSLAQPDARLRALNAEPSVDGERQQVWCTKVGTTRPDEMYLVGAHMDGFGWGDGAGPRLQQPRRADGTLHPLHPVQQRGDRAQRRPRLRGTAAGAAGRRGAPGLRSLPRAQVAGDDPA
jgi:hypothetical protein